MSPKPSYDELKLKVRKIKEQAGALSRMEATLQKKTEERLRFERLLNELSAAFVKISADEIDEKVEAVLQRIGEILGVDRTDFVRLMPETGQF